MYKQLINSEKGGFTLIINDEKLLQYYMGLKGPEAGEWNTSPSCIHTQLVTRDYVKRSFKIFDGIQVCNVGIGTGDWDDYLGYWLKDKGKLTSIDIDDEICGIFQYRQKREGHPNASTVLCKSIFDLDMPQNVFDIVTLIGSSIEESGDFKKCLDSCFRLLKPEGYLMLMAGLKNNGLKLLEKYISHSQACIEQKDSYKAFPEYPFFICKISKGL